MCCGICNFYNVAVAAVGGHQLEEVKTCKLVVSLNDDYQSSSSEASTDGALVDWIS